MESLQDLLIWGLYKDIKNSTLRSQKIEGYAGSSNAVEFRLKRYKYTDFHSGKGGH